MEYDFLVDSYNTERIKTLSVWSMFIDDDFLIRPHPLDQREWIGPDRDFELAES